jgi:hypothetical protein
MAKKSSTSKPLNASTKTSGKKRSPKSPVEQPPTGAPFSEQDPKRRLGNFSGAGEHPRQGSRTAGIVGQTKRRNHTDKAS